jgi:hypothetical protein
MIPVESKLRNRKTLPVDDAGRWSEFLPGSVGITNAMDRASGSQAWLVSKNRNRFSDLFIVIVDGGWVKTSKKVG